MHDTGAAWAAILHDLADLTARLDAAERAQLAYIGALPDSYWDRPGTGNPYRQHAALLGALMHCKEAHDCMTDMYS